MKLILVRHGETKENVNGVIQGHKHGTLTKQGIEQAKKLAKRLKKYKFDLIFCSDLKRAKNTAKEIIKFHPKTKIHYLKELREKNWGVYEGKPNTHLKKSIKFGKSAYLFKPKGGESFKELKERSIKFYKNLIKNYKNKDILVITHGTFILFLLCYLLKVPWKSYHKYHPTNTAVSIIEVDKNNKHKVKLVNCIRHL